MLPPLQVQCTRYRVVAVIANWRLGCNGSGLNKERVTDRPLAGGIGGV